jgi:A/G-specific adenine glycosylase
MSFSSIILQWFKENGRALPWRETRDPYAIWLSEIILQQTRIEQGRPYWERFMRRWPTVNDLAAASEDEVLREWQGLGYYSRARNLHTTAKQIVALGHFPDTYDEIRRLKGVGDYTAAAIGSIAFDLPIAVVDGNVYRVLARHFGISTPINTTEGKKEFAALAQELMENGFSTSNSQLNNYSQYNQAMMDFGAMQCTPTSPDCMACPLTETCSALREGRVGELPVKRKTLKVKERHLTYIYIRYQGETVLHRRPAGDIWQGLYEPLVMENGKFIMENSQLIRKHVKHVLTHRIIYADFWLWEPDERPQLPENYFWIKEEDIDQYGVPRLVELLLEELHK